MLVVSDVVVDEIGNKKAARVWDTWVHNQYEMSNDMLMTMLLSGASGMDLKVRLDSTLNKHMLLIRKMHPFPENNGVLFKNFSEGTDSWLPLEKLQANPAEFGSDVLDYKPLKRARKEKLAGVNSLFSRYISNHKMNGSYANAPSSKFDLLLAGVSQSTEFTVNGDFIFEFTVPRDVCDVGVATVADAMAETYLVDAGLSGEIGTMQLVGTDTTKSLRLAVSKLEGLRFLHGLTYMCWALSSGSIDFSDVDAKGNPVTSLFWGISHNSCFEMQKCDIKEVEAHFSVLSEMKKSFGYDSCYRTEVEHGAIYVNIIWHTSVCDITVGRHIPLGLILKKGKTQRGWSTFSALHPLKLDSRDNGRFSLSEAAFLRTCTSSCVERNYRNRFFERRWTDSGTFNYMLKNGRFDSPVSLGISGLDWQGK